MYSGHQGASCILGGKASTYLNTLLMHTVPGVLIPAKSGGSPRVQCFRVSMRLLVWAPRCVRPGRVGNRNDGAHDVSTLCVDVLVSTHVRDSNPLSLSAPTRQIVKVPTSSCCSVILVHVALCYTCLHDSLDRFNIVQRER